MRLEGRLICGMDIVHAVIDFGPIGAYNYYTKAEIDATKQDKLVSGTNIKTINNQSLLGSGNINIQGGGGDMTNYYTKSETNSLLNAKQNTLVSGTNIKTVGGESLLGSTNVKPVYEFEATVSQGVVTCSETYENLITQITTNGKEVKAKVGTRCYSLQNISGLNIVFTNIASDKLRKLTCGSVSDPTWSYSEQDMDAKPIIFDIEGTESGGVITYTLANGMTFADVDAALTAGKQVRFHDLFNYFDVVAYAPTVTVVAAYTSSTTNEKYTITSSSITREVTSLAPIASPALTGTPTAPTATSGTNTTQIATTAFVNTAAASAGAQGIASVTTPSTPDGTAVITLNNGNTITLNLNHIHDGLIATGEVDRIKFHVCEDETEYTGITTKDANTLYLIPASS